MTIQEQQNGLNGPNGDPEAVGYEIPPFPLGEKKKVRVIVVGGGASAITMAYQVKKHAENVELVAYEKSPELGGTWYDNRYPGCACDVPSHAYQFSYHPYAGWSRFYSGSPEICEYMNSIVDTYGLRDMFKVNHEVVGARWDDEAGQWVVKVKGPEGEFEDRAEFFVNASGILNNWKWPDIEGLSSYKGKLMHTAQWDDNYDFKGKNIAVIGVGSSAVQAIPQLQKVVGHMTCFIRSGAWITDGGAAAKYAGPNGENKDYTDTEKALWAADPEEFLKYRKEVEQEVNARYRMYLKNEELQKQVRAFAEQRMTERLAKKPELAALLTPKFALGCRRLTPGNGFLESLCEDNVTVVSTPIDHIDEKGLVTVDGKHTNVDAIVCATGFDVSLLPRFPFIGKNGADLKKKWTSGPVEGYMSLMVPEYPNYFMFLGPSAPVAHGSLTQTIERCSIWMLKAISKMQAERVVSIAPKADIVRKFNIHRNALMPTTVWSSTCSSWYKNGKADAPVIAIHPGSKLHFFEMIREPRFEDMEIEYEGGNPFAYLGNGFSLVELENDCDHSWYVTQPWDGALPYDRPKKGEQKPVAKKAAVNGNGTL